MGECTWWLWRRRHAAPPAPRRAGLAVALSVLAAGARLGRARGARTSRATSTPAGSRGCRSSSSSLVAVAALLPATPRRVLAVVAGAVLSAICLVKVLDLGFFTAFDRPFKPVDDSRYLGIGIETLRDAVGRSSADLAIAGAVAARRRAPRPPGPGAAAGDAGRRRASRLGAAGGGGAGRRLAGPPRRRRAGRLLERRRPRRRRGPGGAGRAGGSRGARPRARPRPVPRHARPAAAHRACGARTSCSCSSRATDASRSRTRPSRPASTPCSSRGTAQLRAAGFASRSAFLTSPTFGGLSWLAHSTLQAGIRVDGQRRYDQLVDNDRLTLTRAFKRAGWRAVGVMPANRRAWPEGERFYHYDRDLRPAQPRLPRPGLRPAADARPVHAGGPAPPRARRRATGRRSSPRST